jgi:putative SOS response-associated peptidase YedK
MCFFSRLTLTTAELKKRFKAELDSSEKYLPTEEYNGFLYPKTPVITNQNPDKIQMYNWGLMPSWAKDPDFRKNTLNARIESIHEKPSFKPYQKNRCLILVDGFYEWQWLDGLGKKKQKYLITLENKEAFAFAGLWNEWTDVSTGEITGTYTIITRQANELMSVIHNSKQRMPFILTPENESIWLSGEKTDFEDVSLIASPLGFRGVQSSLF